MVTGGNGLQKEDALNPAKCTNTLRLIFHERGKSCHPRIKGTDPDTGRLLDYLHRKNVQTNIRHKLFQIKQQL